jgi:polyhydroxyalkanoate synthesis regulator phasin
MEDIGKKLAKKKAELEELEKARSRANCVSVNSSITETYRQMRIEELEEEIEELERAVKP